RCRGGRALLLPRQRVPLRGQGRRAALPGRRCPPVRRRRADVHRGAGEHGPGEEARRARLRPAARPPRGPDGPAQRSRLRRPSRQGEAWYEDGRGEGRLTATRWRVRLLRMRAPLLTSSLVELLWSRALPGQVNAEQERRDGTDRTRHDE